VRLRLIEQSKISFVSRGDNSAHNNLEKTFGRSGDRTEGTRYIESGQGWARRSDIANERNAYTIYRPWYLFGFESYNLGDSGQGDKALLNIYSVLEVNSTTAEESNTAGGMRSPISCRTANTIGD